MDSLPAKLYGIFSRETEITVGTGVTKRKALSKTYWFAREIDANKVELKSLDADFVPRGEAILLERGEVLDEYLPEPQRTFKHLSGPLMQGDCCRERGNHQGAVREYEKVRTIDEENIRANFGLGISYLAMERHDKALYVFRDILRLDEAFREEHKHLFNEFGISLRRKRLYAETLEFYFKAQEVTSMDENLHFNIARAFFEMGDTDKAVNHLLKALDINSYFEEGHKFAKFLLNGGHLPEDDIRRGQLEFSLKVSGMEP